MATDDLEQRFIKFVAEAGKSPSPFTLDELLILFKSKDGKPSFTRRVLLSELRQTLLGKYSHSQTGTSFVGEFNSAREELATQYLRSTKIPAKQRTLEANRILLVAVSEMDDLYRAETVSLAADIFNPDRVQYFETDQIRQAASYFTDVWKKKHSLNERAVLRRATNLYLRTASVDNGSDASVKSTVRDLNKQLISEAQIALAVLHRRLREVLDSEWPLDNLDSAVPTRIWDEIAGNLHNYWHPGSAAELSKRLAHSSATAGELILQLWELALAFIFAGFALELYGEAIVWIARLHATSDSIRLLSRESQVLDHSFREVLHDIVELQTLRISASHKTPSEATSAIVAMIGPRMREGISHWIAERNEKVFQREHPNASGSAEEMFERRTASLKEGSKYPFDDKKLALLVNRVLDANRSSRIGLGLSGGGFRASFFHFGILARLAELDLLRHVDVISAVSGGSIIAACYYLKLKQLLETKHDADVLRADYITLVYDLFDEFLQGVQVNIRTRIFASVPGIARLWFKRGYTRTDRVAELIASELFTRMTDDQSVITSSFSSLGIIPFGEGDDFDPAKDNWLRSAKVPTLVLNSTTLNTGHNWRFTIKTVGESSFPVDRDLEPTPFYPSVTPENKPAITLAAAVAASACVPGVFPPFELPDFFLRDRVRLVDGGVFDNQGISALIEYGCDIVIVSDGSGQIGFDPMPSLSSWSTLSRANEIVMSRVRQLQFRELHYRYETGSLKHIVSVHLTKGLEVEPRIAYGQYDLDEKVEWEKRFEELIESADYSSRGMVRYRETYYGIAEAVQRLLARIRTDLDSFHQMESFALFWSGYRMAVSELAESPRDSFPTADLDGPEFEWQVAWPWKELKQMVWNSALVTRLGASRYQFFKVAHLRPRSTIGSVAFLICVLSVAVWYGSPYLHITLNVARILFSGALVFVVAAIIAGAINAVRLDKKKRRFVRVLAETLSQWMLGWLLPFAMFLSFVQLYFVDPLYLKEGAVWPGDGRHIRSRPKV